MDSTFSARDVDRSVVITGNGNTASLVFGDTDAVLPLRRLQIRPPERRRALVPGVRRELNLLDPVHAAVPLIGREALLANLVSWSTENNDISVRAFAIRQIARITFDIPSMLDASGIIPRHRVPPSSRQKRRITKD